MTNNNRSIVDKVIGDLGQGKTLSRSQLSEILQNLQKPADQETDPRLSPEERMALLERYRGRPDPRVRARRSLTPKRVPNFVSSREKKQRILNPAPEVAQWLSGGAESGEELTEATILRPSAPAPPSVVGARYGRWWERPGPDSFLGGVGFGFQNDAMESAAGAKGNDLGTAISHWIGKKMWDATRDFSDEEIKEILASPLHGLEATPQAQTTSAKVGESIARAVYPSGRTELAEELGMLMMAGPVGKAIGTGFKTTFRPVLRVIGKGKNSFIRLNKKTTRLVNQVFGRSTDDVIDTSDKAAKRAAAQQQRQVTAKRKDLEKVTQDRLDFWGVRQTDTPTDRVITMRGERGEHSVIFLKQIPLEETKNLGKGLPRTMQEVNAAKSAAQMVGRVGILPEVDELIAAGTIVDPGTVTRAVTALSNAPGMKQILGGVRRITGVKTLSSAGDNILEQARILTGQFDDAVEGGVKIATDTAELLRTKGATIVGGKISLNRVGFVEDVLPVNPDTGLITRTDIKQLRALPGQKRRTPTKITTYDLASWPERYQMPDDVAAYINEVRRVSKDTVAMLKHEGIVIKKKPGEGDYQYLHRYLTEKRREDLDDLVPQVRNTLTQMGILTRWKKRSAESPYEYLLRFTDAVASGRIESTKEISELIARIGNMSGATVRAQSLRKKRDFLTVLDALKHGDKFDHNLVHALRAQVRLSYQMVVRQRIGELLSKMATNSDDIMEAGVKQARDDAYNVRDLLRIVERAVRGDAIQQITPKQMRAFSALHPKEAEALENILTIKPEDMTKAIQRMADEFKANLGITPKRFATALANVRRGVKPNSNITKTQIRKALKETRADDETTVRMITSIYQEAVSYPTRMRKDALESLAARLKTLSEKAEKVAKTSQALYKSERARWNKFVGVETTAAVPKGSVPGFAKKDMAITEQVFNNKKVSGNEIVHEMQKLFGYMGKDFVNNSLLGRMAAFAGIHRLMRASLDLSWIAIQGTAILGIDFFNLTFKSVPHAGKVFLKDVVGVPMLVGKNPPHQSIFGGARSMFTGALDPKHELSFWNNPARQASAWRRARLGGIIQSSEITEGQSQLQALVGVIPGFQARVGRIVKGGISQTYGRADAAWSAGRNITAQLYWESMENIVGPNELANLARATNLLSGTFSFRGVGMSRNQQNFITAFGFFAPRFTYAQTALVAHIFRGGVTAREARKSMLGIIMLNNMVFTLASLALGQEVKINPLPKSMGGDGSDVWTVRIGGTRYGIGGLLYSPMRLIAEIAGAIDDPDEILSREGFISTKNPVIRWWRGKMSGPMSMGWNYRAGEDSYTHEDMRAKLPIPFTEKTYQKWAVFPHIRTLRQFTPIWTESMGGGLLGNVVEFFGGRSRPESLWSTWARMVEEADPQHRSFSQIGRIAAANMTAADPELKKVYDEARKQGEERHWNNAKSNYYEDLGIANDTFNEELREIQQNYIEGDELTDSLKEVRQAIISAKFTYRKALQAVADREEYKDIIADFESEEPKDLIDKAYYEYLSIVHDESNWDATMARPRKSLHTAMDGWEERTPYYIREEIESFKAINMQDRPHLYQQFMESNKALRDYWSIYDEFDEVYPEFAQREKAIERARVAFGTDPMEIERLKAMPIDGRPLKYYIDLRDGYLAQARGEEGSRGMIDAILTMWKYQERTKTTAGLLRLYNLATTWDEDYRLLEQWHNKAGGVSRFEIGKNREKLGYMVQTS